MMIEGPIVRKTVVIPEHTERVLDLDAYWHLDYCGEPVRDGRANDDEQIMLLYARAAWPTLAAAQEQHRVLTSARQADRDAARKRTKQLHRERKVAS